MSLFQCHMAGKYRHTYTYTLAMSSIPSTRMEGKEWERRKQRGRRKRGREGKGDKGEGEMGRMEGILSNDEKKMNPQNLQAER